MPSLSVHTQSASRLDRAACRDVVVARCFDVPVAVGVSDEGLAADVGNRLPPGSRIGATSDPEHFLSLYRSARPHGRSRVHVDGRRILRTESYDMALLALERAIRFTVTRSSREWLFVHAGVVAVGDRAVVLPAESYAGKTQLVRALVLAGATYYSDELAAVDDEGLLHPYPKQLTIRQPGSFGRDRVPAEALGGRVGDRPVRAALIVATRYEHGAEWAPRTLTPGEATIALLRNTLQTQMDRPAALRRLGRVAAGAAAIETLRGDAGAAASAILDRLERQPSIQRGEVVTT